MKNTKNTFNIIDQITDKNTDPIPNAPQSSIYQNVDKLLCVPLQLW